MSSFKNRVQLIGHLGAEPELKSFEKGGKMCRLRIATNESFKNNKGEWVEETQWHSITLWDSLADRAMQQCNKGSYLMIEGKLMNRSYTDASGIKKYSIEIRATNFMALDKKQSHAPADTSGMMEEEDNGLPF